MPRPGPVYGKAVKGWRREQVAFSLEMRVTAPHRERVSLSLVQGEN